MATDIQIQTYHGFLVESINVYKKHEKYWQEQLRTEKSMLAEYNGEADLDRHDERIAQIKRCMKEIEINTAIITQLSGCLRVFEWRFEVPRPESKLNVNGDFNELEEM